MLEERTRPCVSRCDALRHWSRPKLDNDAQRDRKATLALKPSVSAMAAPTVLVASAAPVLRAVVWPVAPRPVFRPVPTLWAARPFLPSPRPPVTAAVRVPPLPGLVTISPAPASAPQVISCCLVCFGGWGCSCPYFIHPMPARVCRAGGLRAASPSYTASQPEPCTAWAGFVPSAPMRCSIMTAGNKPGGISVPVPVPVPVSVPGAVPLALLGVGVPAAVGSAWPGGSSCSQSAFHARPQPPPLLSSCRPIRRPLTKGNGAAGTPASGLGM